MFRLSARPSRRCPPHAHTRTRSRFVSFLRRALGRADPAAPLPRSALTYRADAWGVARDLAGALAPAEPRAILFFCSPEHDGAAISRLLRARFAEAEVMGCTTAGEHAEGRGGQGGVSALALPCGRVRSAASALARWDGGGADGVMRAALADVARKAGVDLRQADPRRWVAVVLADGLSDRAAEVEQVLADEAPNLPAVLALAGDDAAFRETRVFRAGEGTSRGAGVLLLEMALPFTILRVDRPPPAGGRDSLADGEEALRRARARLGRRVAGALLFQHLLHHRRLAAEGEDAAFLRCFSAFPTAGFRTYGGASGEGGDGGCDGILFA